MNILKNFLVPLSTWERASKKSNIFNVSEVLRMLLDAYNEGIIDIFEIAQKLNKKDEN